MTSQIKFAKTMVSVPSDDNWAERFLSRGWRKSHDWVVLEKVPCGARQFKRILSETTGGFLFGTFSYRVLYAPTFLEFGKIETRLRIVEAIRDYPQQRSARFETFERPTWMASGVEEAILEKLSCQARSQLDPNSFHSPVLVVTAHSEPGKYMLVGAVATLDMLLSALVTSPGVAVNEGLALLILYTCHGNPSEHTFDTTTEGTRLPRFTYNKSAFTNPFHPRRYAQVRAALRARCATPSKRELQDELHRMLAKHIPCAVASLRRNPTGRLSHINSLFRSRLVELVSDDLQIAGSIAKHRSARDCWWTRIDEMHPRSVRRYLNTLTSFERNALTVAREGKRLVATSSTRRVHLHHAKTKFHIHLREQVE